MTTNTHSPSRGVRIVLAAFITLLSIGVLEAALRIVGQTDADGNFSLRHRQALPLHMPVSRLEEAVRQYRQSNQSLFTEDAQLGWKPRAGAQNDLYAYNAAGLRARTPADAVPEQIGNTLRVAIFGDSFAHGSEVPFAESWGARIEDALDRPDRPAQVLNFGVPGYGMDQAYLRWQQEGLRYAPDVVIFGVQVENAGRNLNLLRVLYDSADLPFAKPRFVASGDRLQLVNVPVPPPEEVVRIVRSIDEWPLIEYERYYEREKYRGSLLRHSRLVGVIEGAIAGVSRGQLEGELPEEQRQLALKIINEFARSVEATGAHFVAVHLPRRVDLEHVRANGRMPNLGFIDAIEKSAPVVRIDEALLARAGEGDLGPLFRPGGHYSPEGYALLAESVVQRLQSDLASRVGTN